MAHVTHYVAYYMARNTEGAFKCAARRGARRSARGRRARRGALAGRLVRLKPDSLARSRRPAAAGATLAVSLCTGGACRPVSSRARRELVAARAGRQRGDGLSVGLGVGFAHAEALLRVQGRGGPQAHLGHLTTQRLVHNSRAPGAACGH